MNLEPEIVKRLLWSAGAVVAVVLAALLLTDRPQADAPKSATSTGDWQWRLPAHVPAPRVPADNPMSEAKFELGRYLFHDKRLSGNGTMACAACHIQKLAFTDGLAVSTGSTGEHTARSAPSIANAAWHPSLTWANYSIVGLERHMLVPMFGEFPIEMGLTENNKAEIVARFAGNADYPAKFAAAFPGEAAPVTLGNIIAAISSFMRGVVSVDSRYDRYLAGMVTLSDAEERGRQLFFSEKAQCSACHGSYHFNDQYSDITTKQAATPFHNTGLYNVDGKGGFPEPNRGIFELSGQMRDMGAFRAASLRNIAITAPYMHDGSIATLEEVLAFYAGHGRNLGKGGPVGDGRQNPYKDARINQINLTPAEQGDIISFLKTLTDETLRTNPRYADPFAVAVAVR